MVCQIDSRHFVHSVCGSIPASKMGVCDSHNHLWIDRVDGSQADAPVLNDESTILKELNEYHFRGGTSQVDCQPGGAGRDARRLRHLSTASRVNIVACTGFHLPKYYSPNHWLFNSTSEEISIYFIKELTVSLEETQKEEKTVKAGFIKIACRATFAEMPHFLLEATADAARQVNCAIEMHTEKGSQAELFVDFFLREGIKPSNLIICHIDKRPDFYLHHELAKCGVLLEYDTFFRPKYDPDHHLWPLIEMMLEAGLGDHLALATDLAEVALWKAFSGGPGLPGFIDQIRPRLEMIAGKNSSAINNLLGGNIARALATFSN
jgi:5-phospho-D-xylono-1,4-lactonase